MLFEGMLSISRRLDSIDQPLFGRSVPDQPRIGRAQMWTTRPWGRVFLFVVIRFLNGGWLVFRGFGIW